ncbi:UDP-glycosyltransferase UGT5-like [Metopolophium dirhodum]|uniref:UDP-glycosyltransferase UGT5-like n=1 Tax=Metopolophium dirhodum TaxID=44670 RepID=UPI0029900C47|nr:UDP-glycosyltransferase UGT5-like [Metopolophium dirhodum]XP_060872472.1 UDP-glycosyltransferase UGT5-like [Metopolophium dirhodum]
MNSIILITGILISVNSGLSSNILAFLPSKARSHYGAFEPLLKELARKGHNVTVFSPFSMKNPPSSYHHIQVEDEDLVMSFNPFSVAKHFKPILVPFRSWFMWPKFTETILNKPSVQKLIHSEGLHFDLVLFENFYHECFVTLGHKFNASVVQLFPSIPNAGVAQWHRNPYDGSYIPDINTGFCDNMSFIERLTNTVLSFIHTALSSFFYFPKQRDLMDKYFNYTGWETRPSMENMLKNISLTLINTHFSVGTPRPLVPSYIDVAGMHLKPASTLPEDLLDIMNNAPEGVVFFSFGSILKPTQLPKNEFDIFIRQLSKIKQKVLFKWESDTKIDFPPNIIVRKWFPQADILGHPNCVLFITHGGIQSTEEAIYFGVPMLAISVFGDQLHNSLVMQNRGAAIRLKYSEFTENEFEIALHKMLNDKSFKKKAAELSLIFRDQPLKSLNKAIYWIEYVIHHNGAHHLKTAAGELTWYEFLLIDGLFLVVIMRIIITIILWYVGKKLWRRFCCLKSKKI